MAVDIRHEGGIVIIEPHGRIVGPRVAELRQAILPEVKAYDVPHILINFEHTTGMNSSGLGILVQAYTIAKQKKGRMGVIHIGRHIKNLLVLSRLTTLFEHFENEMEAIEALSI